MQGIEVCKAVKVVTHLETPEKLLQCGDPDSTQGSMFRKGAHGKLVVWSMCFIRESSP